MPRITKEQIHLPLLQLVADLGEFRLRDIVPQLADHFSLTDVERREVVPSGRTKWFDYRCGWAQKDLKEAGLIESTRHGYHRITARGVEVLGQNLESIDNRFLKQLRESLEPSHNPPTPEKSALLPLGPHNDAELDLTEDEKTVLNAIEASSSHIDTIVRTTQFPTARVSSLLLMLELKGIVEQMPGKQFNKVEHGMKPRRTAPAPVALDSTIQDELSSKDEKSESVFVDERTFQNASTETSVSRPPNPSQELANEGDGAITERRSARLGIRSIPPSAPETKESESVNSLPVVNENENTTFEAIKTHSSNVDDLGHTAQQQIAIATTIRTAWDPVEKKEFELEFPAPEEVRRALLVIEYPPNGIRIRDIVERLAEGFSLTVEQLRATKSKKNSHCVFYDRVYNQVDALVRLGKLIRLDSGEVAYPEQEFSRDGISTEVTEDAGDTPNVLDDTTHHGKKEGVDVPTLEEMIETNYREFREDLVTRLQERIAGNSPFFFRELVVNLLVQMGYGCSPRNIESIGRSDDGGIDGLVNEDKFGLESVYIQAKWREETVDQSEVQKLALALRQHQTRKGIFITPSKFSEDAREYVNAIDSKIVLIDGRQLAELMIEYNVGVSTVKTYELKRVDSDYFIETDDSQTQDS